MQSLKEILNDTGISMVQVMIAGAMLAGLAVVSMRIMDNQTKMTQKMYSDTDMMQFKGIVSSFFNQQRTCTNALSGLKKGEDFQSLRFQDQSLDVSQDNSFLTVGDPLGSTGFTLTSLRVLTDDEAINSNVSIGNITGLNNYVVVRMGLEQTKNVLGGKNKILDFPVVVDLGDKVAIAHQTANEVEERCETNYNGIIEGDITYDESYLGICEATEGQIILGCGN
jgi:Tfp pilus assembly protein PilE